MRVDWEIAKRGWRRYAAYPLATAAGVFTNTVFGFLQAYILLAVFRHRAMVGSYDSLRAVTYVWLVQSLLATVNVFGWSEVALRIRDGAIATDLSRPINPQRYWLAFDLGRAPYHLVFRGVVPFVVGALVFRLRYPSPADAVAFVVSLALAVVVSLGFRFLYNLPAFWIIDIRGVFIVVISLNLFFSGMVMPIAFFPSWLGHLAQVLPFASILQTPIDVWLGVHRGWNLAGVLALQVGWAIVLLGVGRLVLRKATRKLVIQGG